MSYILAMHIRVLPVIALCLLTFPAAALEEQDDGTEQMRKGLELFMEGLRGEMAPALKDLKGLADQFGPSMRSFLQEMGPAFGEIIDSVKDWTDYHPPEMLPNGDIILRKKTAPQPPAEPLPPPPGGIDL